MSIAVKDVSKLYGEQKALDQVSFEIGKSGIVGFLGPNGAGKSTMMKIITCYIPQSSGTVHVCGESVEENSMLVREKVGYLPEHNPLYLDMYVKEYLDFIAGVHKLSGREKRVKEMIDMVGLGLEQRKKIGALSKGYRQRVGLAQAMIHNPEVLILDEPTSGLDPNQLVEIRKLIVELGKEKTVMMSTHIMQEVEALCERVIIINKGKIVADEKASALRSDSTSEAIFVVEFDKKIDAAMLRKIANVKQVTPQEGNTWHITAKGTEDLRNAIFQFAVKENLSVLTLAKKELKLEDVFKQLTK